MALGFSKDTELYEQAPGGGVNLRHPGWSEFDEWAKLRGANANHLMPWEPEWTEHHLSRGSYRSRLSAYKKMIGEGRGYPFHIFRAGDSRLIGACNISDVQRHAAQSAQIGYWIGSEYSKQGYARAAVRATIRFAFDDLGLHRLFAAVQASNTPSVALLEAVGFQREGTARGYLQIGGTWKDHDIYGLLSSD